MGEAEEGPHGQNGKRESRRRAERPARGAHPRAREGEKPEDRDQGAGTEIAPGGAEGGVGSDEVEEAHAGEGARAEAAGRAREQEARVGTTRETARTEHFKERERMEKTRAGSPGRQARRRQLSNTEARSR